MINMLTRSARLPGLTKTKGIMLASLIAGVALAYPAMAADQVPYQAEELGVVTKGAFQFPFAHESTVAEGEATLFGHYALTGDFVVDVRFGTATGVFTLTAANGDTLLLDMDGHGVPTDITKTVANFTVTGGTGRFEGATGTFTADNQFDFAVNLPAPNPYVAEIEGTISPVPDGGRGSALIAASSLVGVGLLLRGRKATGVFVESIAAVFSTTAHYC